MIFFITRFGEAEGFVDKELEKFIFREIGSIEVGPKELVCGSGWRIEEYIVDGTHPDSECEID